MQRKLWMVGVSGALLLGCGGDDGNENNGVDAGNGGVDGAVADGAVVDGGGGLDASVPAEPKVTNAGAPCTEATVATDCTGPMASCMTQYMTPALPGSNEPNEPIEFPGGICTASCSDDGHCGTGGGCLGLAVQMAIESSEIGMSLGSFIPLPLTCAQLCSSVAECRDGYQCNNLIDALGEIPEEYQQYLPLVGINPATLPKYCLPEPPPEPDAGMTDAGVGDAGDTDAGDTDAGDTDAGDADAGDAG